MAINNIRDRMNAQNQVISTPMACKICGGTYFTDGHAHQYSNQGYGSAQFRQISVTPVAVKQCVGCGNFVYPDNSGGAVAPGSSPQFQESIKAGREYREKQSLNANAVASKRELDAAGKNIASLESQVKSLESEINSVRTELLEAISQLTINISAEGLSEAETNVLNEASETVKIPRRTRARTQPSGPEHK